MTAASRNGEWAIVEPLLVAADLILRGGGKTIPTPVSASTEPSHRLRAFLSASVEDFDDPASVQFDDDEADCTQLPWVDPTEARNRRTKLALFL
jgi:hypothetical protein